MAATSGPFFVFSIPETDALDFKKQYSKCDALKNEEILDDCSKKRSKFMATLRAQDCDSMISVLRNMFS